MEFTNSAKSREGARPKVRAHSPAAASHELTGGARFMFEDAVALLSESTAPGLPNRQVRHVQNPKSDMTEALSRDELESRIADLTQRADAGFAGSAGDLVHV